MIIQEAGTILEHADSGSIELNRLVDEFRKHREVNELLVLFNSDSDELVEIETWILSEIRPEKYDHAEILDGLRELTLYES